MHARGPTPTEPSPWIWRIKLGFLLVTASPEDMAPIRLISARGVVRRSSVRMPLACRYPAIIGGGECGPQNHAAPAIGRSRCTCIWLLNDVPTRASPRPKSAAKHHRIQWLVWGIVIPSFGPCWKILRRRARRWTSNGLDMLTISVGG